MFFGDRTVLRTGQFEGHLLAGHHQEFIRPVVMCRFGFGQAPSLAAISQTLDKLLIYDLSQLRDRLQTMTTSTTSSQNDQLESSGSGQPKQVCYISIKEQVIETLAVASPSPGSSSLERDFLLIGCSASVMIYDTYEQAHLFSVNTSSRITSMAVASSAQSQASLLLCGGLQKLYAYQLEWRPTTGHLDVEISSERTTSEYVSCLIWGRHQSGGIGPPQQCLVTGSCEQKIRVYSIDPLEQDIQTCRLTLQETGRVTCLCAIETLQRDAHQTSSTTRQRRLSPSSSHRDDDHKAGLPSVSGQRTQDQGVAASQSREQLEMSYFAYGLENGSIGVYHLLVSQAEGAHQSAARATQLFGERLWRHKAKEMPVSLVMFDIDGDGLDELVIGFRSGRLEVRSPFTGQLLASTRCFRSSSSVHLLCLVRWPLEPVIASDGQVAATPPTDDAVGLQAKTQVGTTQQVLLACSSSSSLVAFRPQQKRPHEPLRDYLASSTGHYNAKATGESPKEDLMLTLAEEARQLGAESLLLDSGNKPANLSSSNQEDEQDLDQEQPPKATACESRQSAELMQRVGATRNKQLKLELRFKQLYQELLQRQLAASQAAQEYLAGGTTVEDRLQLAHCWDFDPSEDKLQLVLYLGGLGGCPFSGSIDMIELVDESRALIGSGHLLVSPVDVIVRSSASIGAEPQMEASGVSRIAPVASLVKLKLNSERLASLRDDSDEKVELMLSLFTSGCESKTRPNNQSQARALHQQAITLPKFGLFVPECLREPSGSKELPNNQVASRPMIRTHFSSPDGANRLQVSWPARLDFGSKCGIVCIEDFLDESLEKQLLKWLSDVPSNKTVAATSTGSD